MSRTPQLVSSAIVVMCLLVETNLAQAVNYSGAIAQARRMYQQQMKEQAAIQKANDLAEQQAAAAQAAEDRRKMELIAKGRRNAHEKEAKHREAILARLRAENAAKEAGIKPGNAPKVDAPKSK